MAVELRTLNINDEAAFLSAVSDWPENERGWITFSWTPGIDFADHVKKLELDQKGIDLEENRVQHTMFYGFVNGNIIGRVSVRHTLNDFLLERGGNIGYAVAEKYRKLGYASDMVKQSIAYCKEIGLNRILITCDDNNIASIKIIESIGGQLENKITIDGQNELLRRYWIDI